MPPLGALSGVSSVKLRTFLKVGSALTVVLAGALLLLSLHAYMTAMVSVAEGVESKLTSLARRDPYWSGSP